MADPRDDVSTRVRRVLDGYAEALESGRVADLDTLAEGADAAWFARLADSVRDRPPVGDDDSQGQERIGPYVVEREIGRGAQGVVYRARDDRLGRDVALKVLDGLQAVSGSARERLQREARAAARLVHPGLCPVYDFGRDGGRFYLAMRYVEGQPLSEFIASTPEPPRGDELRARVRLVAGMAEAAHAAHEIGVVHRDIKPSNTLVTPEGAPVIVDFGLARAGDDASLTHGHDFVGSLRYAAPETLSSSGHADARRDVYAIGVVLYELLCLRPPFEAPTAERLVVAIQQEAPVPPRRSNPAIGSTLELVMLTAIEKEPARRYQSAAHLARDLECVLDARPIHARPVPRRVRVREWMRREPVVAGSVFAVFALLVIGLAGTTWFLFALADKQAESNAHAAESERTLDEWNRLADRTRLEELQQDAEAFRPDTPEDVDAMSDWLVRARALLARLPGHEAALARLRGSARPLDEDAEAEARRPLDERIATLDGEDDDHDRFVRHATTQRDRYLRGRDRAEPGSVAHMRRSLGAELWGDFLTTLEDRERERRRERSNLEARLAGRLVWTFSDPSDQIRHDNLARVIDGLRELGEDDARPTRPTIAALTARRDAARGLADDGAWRDLPPVRITREGEVVELRPQRGLVPLGRDPESGLHEFADVRSGVVPERVPGESLRMKPGGAVVFVLVPGGVYTPVPQEGGAPPSPVRLDPFFISKFELTQGQWMRFGANPSTYAPGLRFGGSHRNPVEDLSWEDAQRFVSRLGWELPTAVQWEYAARGGAEGTRWCPRSEFGASENLADATLKASKHAAAGRSCVPWEDGWITTAPVGSLLANPFGLHDVLGNVSEWCRDANLNDRFAGPREGDGLRTVRATNPVRRQLVEVTRMFRGGSFLSIFELARADRYVVTAKTTRRTDVGLRPVRRLDALRPGR